MSPSGKPVPRSFFKGCQLEQADRIGEFSIEAIDLNRLALRKLRDIRQRVTKCAELVTSGVLALRRFHIDQLPPDVKGSAAATIAQAIKAAEGTADEIDSLLRQYAHSPLIDPDPESDKRAKERAAKLEGWNVLHPGSWRAPRAMAKIPKRVGKQKRRK